MVDMGQRDSTGDADAPFVLLLEENIRQALVDADTKAFQLGFDNPLVCERLVDIEDDEDKMTSLGNCNDLTAAALSVFGSLNNTRQIKHLNLSSVIGDLARDSGERSKLVSSNCDADEPRVQEA